MAQPGSLVYNAEFTADTAGAKQSLKDYQTQIRAVKEEINQATREAKDNYRIQMLAARAAGAGPEELARITQEYNQSLLAVRNTQTRLTDTILQGNYAAMESEKALDAIRKEALNTINAQTIAIQEYAAANEVAHKVSNQSAASGFVMGVEGKTSRRAMEVFLGQTLGLQGAFQDLFPFVAGAQFVVMLGEMGKSIYELEEKGRHAGDEISAAFEDMGRKGQLSLDQLQVEIDKVQAHIDKMEGHPNNGLALALDEARVKADQLLVSLKADRKAIEALLKERNVSIIGGVLSNVANTGRQSDEIRADLSSDTNRQVQATDRYNVALTNSKSDADRKAAGQQYNNDLKQIFSDRISIYQTEITRLQQLQKQHNSLSIMERGGFGDPGDQGAKIANLQGVVDDDRRKINSLNLQQTLENVKEREGIDVQAKALSSGSHRSRIDEAKKELADWKKLQTEVRETLAESARLATRYAKDTSGLSNDFDAASQRDQQAQIAVGAKMTADFVKSLSSLSSATINANRAAAEQAIVQDFTSGKISAYDAAVQRQTLHTKQYSEALEQLQAALANVSGDSLESNTRRNVIRQRIVELNAGRVPQQIQDTATVAQATIGGALKDANEQWLANARNLAPQVRSAYESTVNGLNDALSRVLAGQKVSWSSFFAGMAEQLAKIGLNGLEGNLLGSLQSKSGSDGFLGTIGSFFGGFRADGGPVEAGKTYIVGERGPEPVTFGSSGRMGTNRDLSALGGSSHSWNISVDARGATNPAEVEQAAHRAVMRMAPSIVAASMKAQKDSNARTPSLGRR